MIAINMKPTLLILICSVTACAQYMPGGGGGVTPAVLDSGTLSAAFMGLSATGDINAGGNVYANTASSAAGCLHLSDANAAHDMGICAPSSGFNGLLNLPAAQGAANQVVGVDGSNNLQWQTVAVFVALKNLTAQTANIASTSLYAVGAAGAGSYRANCYIVLTTAASSSSTLPACGVGFKDEDSGTTVTMPLTGTATTNTVGTNKGATSMLNVAAGSTMTYYTSGYASTAAGMAYAVHWKLEYLGP